MNCLGGGTTLRIGIAFDLKTDFSGTVVRTEDALEEYDSAQTVTAIADALRKAGHAVIPLGGGRPLIERLLAASAERSLDLLFNIAEGYGSRSREAHVPALCEMAGLPYTHSDPLTLALTLDKAMTKRIAMTCGIATAPFCLIEEVEDLHTTQLPPFPVVAKPNAEGSSMGIGRDSLCFDHKSLARRVAVLLSGYRQPVLVESFLPGAEVTVAIAGNGPAVRVLAAMQIAPRRANSRSFLYDLETKRNYLAEVIYHVPPLLPESAIAQIEQNALAAYRALGCRDIARIDLRFDSQDRPCLIEVNALPGLDPLRSDVPILCARAGIPYERLLAEIVADAARRCGMRKT
jgi:D-alanine-D-alanine ligase